jgi:hypothetical protein
MASQEFTKVELSGVTSGNEGVALQGAGDAVVIHTVPAGAKDKVTLKAHNLDPTTEALVLTTYVDGIPITIDGPAAAVPASGSVEFEPVELLPGEVLSASISGGTSYDTWWFDNAVSDLVPLVYSTTTVNILSSADGFDAIVKQFLSTDPDWPFTAIQLVAAFFQGNLFWVMAHTAGGTLELCAYDPYKGAWGTLQTFAGLGSYNATKNRGVLVGDRYYTAGTGQIGAFDLSTPAAVTVTETALPSSTSYHPIFVLPGNADILVVSKPIPNASILWTYDISADPDVPVLLDTNTEGGSGYYFTDNATTYYSSTVVACSGVFDIFWAGSQSTSYKSCYFLINKTTGLITFKGDPTSGGNSVMYFHGKKTDTIYAYRTLATAGLRRYAFNPTTGAATETSMVGGYTTAPNYAFQYGNTSYFSNSTTTWKKYDVNLEVNHAVPIGATVAAVGAYWFWSYPYIDSAGHGRILIGYNSAFAVYNTTSEDWDEGSNGLIYVQFGAHHAGSGTLYIAGASQTSIGVYDDAALTLVESKLTEGPRYVNRMLVEGDNLFAHLSDNYIYRYSINVTTGALTYEDKSSGSVHSGANIALASDGTYIYIMSSSTWVYRVKISDMVQSHVVFGNNFYVPTGTYGIPNGLVCDGTYLYGWDSASIGTLNKFDPSDGTLLGQIAGFSTTGGEQKQIHYHPGTGYIVAMWLGDDRAVAVDTATFTIVDATNQYDNLVANRTASCILDPATAGVNVYSDNDWGTTIDYALLAFPGETSPHDTFPVTDMIDHQVNQKGHSAPQAALSSLTAMAYEKGVIVGGTALRITDGA